MYHGQLGQEEEGWFTRFTRGLVSALPSAEERARASLPPPPTRPTFPAAIAGAVGGWGTPALVLGGLGLGALGFMLLGQKGRR